MRFSARSEHLSDHEVRHSAAQMTRHGHGETGIVSFLSDRCSNIQLVERRIDQYIERQ